MPDVAMHAVRAHFIEALSRRAAAHGGLVRRILDEKLARLAAERDRDDGGDSADRIDGADSGPGPLAELLVVLQRHGQVAEPDGAIATTTARATGGAAAPHAGRHPSELKALHYFRKTWSRLNSQQRLVQSRSALPDNAGPLNSHHLVHRALMVMRDASPEYLDRFTSYVDALLWLERADELSALPDATPAPRGSWPRKSGRARAR